MKIGLSRSAAIAALVPIGLLGASLAALLGAPLAAADTNPSVPGDPTSVIYNPPGYIGYYPGVYGFQSIFSLTPPKRVLDAAGAAAMTNADPESSHVGLPGDRLGVQTTHVVVKPREAGPQGQVFGPRTSEPVQESEVPEAAGGVMPGATSTSGRQNLATGQPVGLEDPAPTGQQADQPIPGLEARQPGHSSVAAPDTAN